MKTLGEMIERNARFYADREALVFGERRLTHGEIATRARRFSGALYDRGLRRQDRVAVLAMNCAEYYETYRACEWAGFLLNLGSGATCQCTWRLPCWRTRLRRAQRWWR